MGSVCAQVHNISTVLFPQTGRHRPPIATGHSLTSLGSCLPSESTGRSFILLSTTFFDVSSSCLAISSAVPNFFALPFFLSFLAKKSSRSAMAIRCTLATWVPHVRQKDGHRLLFRKRRNSSWIFLAAGNGRANDGWKTETNDTTCARLSKSAALLVLSRARLDHTMRFDGRQRPKVVFSRFNEIVQTICNIFCIVLM